MKKSFKVIHGYRAEDEILIDKTELASAYYAYMTNGSFTAKDGDSWKGKILGIKTNWHAVMGWSQGYKITAEDMGRIGGSRRAHAEQLKRGAIELAKQAIANKDKSILEQVPVLLESNNKLSTEKIDTKLDLRYDRAITN